MKAQIVETENVNGCRIWIVKNNGRSESYRRKAYANHVKAVLDAGGEWPKYMPDELLASEIPS
jgi:hypothetical protein